MTDQPRTQAICPGPAAPQTMHRDVPNPNCPECGANAEPCPYCGGQGWTAEHDPNCHGNCEQWGCPIQWGCAQCNGGGFVERPEPSGEPFEPPF